MIFLLLACTNTGTVSLGGDDTASTSDDTASVDDTGEVADHDPNGDYEGEFVVNVYWAVWDEKFSCGDDGEITVDDGRVEGYGGCYLDFGDSGISFDAYIEGELDDDNQFEGTALILLNDGVREDESPAKGDFSSDSATAEGGGDMTAYNENMDYGWELNLEKQ
jgi:hypothetical protein